MNDQQLIIQKLKKEKNAVIMAHYYVRPEIQEIADYVGDSYYLSEAATQIKEEVIVLCGVKFMGETAKLLNPEKRVLLPASDADCPMAHMADIEEINKLRLQYEDLAVVCYVNSTAELKMHADVCVTSSNALKIVRSLPNKNIFFVPDEHLGSYIAKQVPEKNMILNKGYCPVHNAILSEDVKKAKENHPDAKVLIHPECPASVIELADYAGSTTGIINYASSSECQEFIICTEEGILYQLQKENPNKHFYFVNQMQVCEDMKKITLDKVIDALRKDDAGLSLDAEFLAKAKKPLERMLELSK